MAGVSLQGHVMHFFSYIHEHLAETLSEANVREDNPYLVIEDSEELSQLQECTVAEDIPVAQHCTDATSKEEKWLAFHTLPDLFAMMTYWVKTHLSVAVPSINTFRRVFVQRRPVLKIRDRGQHARCTLCAEISEALSKTNDPQQRSDLVETRERHLASMFSDRDVEMRIARLSEASCSSSRGSTSGRVLKIDIDGMDQAKFKSPRNLINAHSMKDLWRPTLHVVGVICW